MQQNEMAFKLKFGVTDNNSYVRSHALIILLFPSPFSTKGPVKKRKGTDKSVPSTDYKQITNGWAAYPTSQLPLRGASGAFLTSLLFYTIIFTLKEVTCQFY